jgi:hypothetical protein
MAEFTKTNGTGFDHGVQYSVAQLKCMEVDALVDITSKDALGGCIDTIVQEFQPLLYKSTGTAGKIFMIVDGHAVTAASMQVRLRAIGTTSDSIDLSSGIVLERDIDAFDAT